jgi:DNA-binding phage protein
MSLDPHCRAVAERLISFWKRHRGFDANIAGLARAAGVSRDTVYRWLRRQALPRPGKALLVEEWLNSRGAAR